MELRKDYILDRWVIIASSRKARPKELKKGKTVKEEKTCYFCPGNEHLTPEETGRIGTNKKWNIRWFPNKFPALVPEGQSDIRTDNKYYTFSAAYGKHEIIAETPNHKKQLADLKIEEIAELLKVYANRISELGNEPSIAYVSVFKNHGLEAGTSIIHSHSQVMALNFIPALVREEIEATKKFNSCPYCEIIQSEKNSYRRIYENNGFVSFTPYASRFNYEAWIFPKEHLTNITQMNDEKLFQLAEVMKKIVYAIKELNVSYNYYLHYSPQNEDLHFHIEVCPRIAIYGGFELSTNAIINTISPEDAAEYYRSRIR